MSYDYSFHQRVRDTIIECARSYKRIFLDYEYLLCSEAFQVHDYYIIDAREDNYKHLTGVNSSLKASEFFEKCYQGTLLDSDFDFNKASPCHSDNKGSVRRKIKVLPGVFSLFEGDMEIEEAKLMLIRTLELELSGKIGRNIQNAKIFLTFHIHMARIIHRFQNQQ